jgi:SPP1 gp7 family putative phage head morphogenesis protein
LSALGLSEEEGIEVADRAARQAAAIALIAQAQAVRQIWETIEAARVAGLSVDEAKAQISDLLNREWIGTESQYGWRLERLAQLSAQMAYSRGRWTEMTAAGALDDSPAWEYTSALESRTCAFCRSLHGTVLPATDPWWLEHNPPLHPACLCAIIPAASGAQLTEDPPDAAPDAGFGGPPEEYEADWSDFPAPISAVARTKKF